MLNFLYQLVEKIARTVDEFDGVQRTFYVDYLGWRASCRYTAMIGGNVCATSVSSWEIDDIRVDVLSLRNSDGEEEPTMRRWVENQLN